MSSWAKLGAAIVLLLAVSGAVFWLAILPDSADSEHPASPSQSSGDSSVHASSAPLEDAVATHVPGEVVAGNGDAKSARRALAGPLIESILISEGGIRVDHASRLVESDKFSAFLDELEHQSASDLEARELTTAYQSELTATIVGSQLDLNVERLACGLEICAADLQGHSSNDELFTPIMNSGDKSGAKLYSAVTAIVANQDGSFSYRMIFSTDPSLNSLQVPTADWNSPRPRKP